MRARARVPIRVRAADTLGPNPYPNLHPNPTLHVLQVLSAIAIAFVGLEVLLSLLTIITFAKAPPPQADN